MMESLFVILSAMVVAVRGLSKEVGDALDFVLDKMRAEWADQKDELSYLRERYSRNEEQNGLLLDKNDALQSRVRELEQSMKELEQSMKDGGTLLDDHKMCWRITFPPDEMAQRKITCIKAIRMTTNLGLKEAKELVESRIEHKEQLFNFRLTTKQFIAAMQVLTEGSSTSSIPANCITVTKENYYNS